MQNHFEVSADHVDSVGLGVQTIALWVGNTIVAQTGGVGHVDEPAPDT